MKRALNTCALALRDALLREEVKVYALPELQNMDKGPSGNGMDLEELENFYAANEKLNVWDYMVEGWNKKNAGRWSPEEVKWRCDHLKGFLKGLSVGKGLVEVVVVVTHGSHLKKLVENGMLSL